MARAVLVHVGLLACVEPLVAHEFDERVSLEGVASLAGQCQDDGTCRGALAFQPALRVLPGDAHEVFVKLGFASGNVLNDVTSFSLAPWAADLQETVENLDGGRRDVLLTAWYGHEVDLGGDEVFRITAGIIDSTDFVDTNAYSNDEYSQFMNSALVNGPNVFVPSYAPGLAAQWLAKRVSLTGVAMRVGREDADSFDFYGIEFAYHVDSSLGRGTYRLLLDSTSQQFEAATSDGSLARQTALLLSCDQQLGKVVGAFVRIARQSDEPAIDYRSLFSGGLDIGGSAWGRSDDNVGVGFAHLTGGNGDIARTRVAEAYYRFVVAPALAITGDLQYMDDDLRIGPGTAGWIFGLRATTRF